MHVALLVSNPTLDAKVVKSPVSNQQVPASILKFLGIDPNQLEAVQTEQVNVLPFLFNEGEIRAETAGDSAVILDPENQRALCNYRASFFCLSHPMHSSTGTLEKRYRKAARWKLPILALMLYSEILYRDCMCRKLRGDACQM